MFDTDTLIKECITGNRMAMQKLYEQHSNKLLGISRRYASNYDEAKDWMHEAWLRIFENLNNYNSERSFEGWLCIMMRNIAIEMVRKQNKLNFINIDEYEVGSEDLEESEFEEIMDKFNQEDLLKMMESLPTQYKLVFNLYAIENMNHQEIAAKLNIAEATSRSNLKRARVKLIDKIRSYHKKETGQKSITSS